MHAGLVHYTSHAMPDRRRQSRLRLVMSMCLLAVGGCAPGYGDYIDSAERPAGKARRTATAAVSTPLRPIQAPRQALLEPISQPDCEIADRPGGLGAADAHRTASVEPMPAQPPADAELALRIKVEYEKECYKQAEQRVRARLQGLQTWTAETIKAAGRTSESATR